MLEESCVHGRFQPPHKGHEKYILMAKERCRFLWIGITQYDVRNLAPCDAASHRSERINNPLTYFERVQLLTVIMRGAGYDRREFGFVPFPVDCPEILADFMPVGIPCFTTICNEWNVRKVEILKQRGYMVEVLGHDEQKEYTGTRIRASMLGGDGTWREMVPSGTVAMLEKFDIPARLRKAAEGA